MKSFMRKWGAVVILTVMFLGSWIGQFVAQLLEVTTEAQEHGGRFEWADFWPQFLSATFENWQSEFLQLAFQTVLIASYFQAFFFQADFGADKQDVAEINGKLDALLGIRQSTDGSE